MNNIFTGPGLLRFLLAFVVVVHHSFPLRMGSWAVYAFFILSGYWIARMWEDKYASTRQAPFTFLCSRWCRLAPVFFVSLALAFVSSCLVTGAPPLPQHLGEWMLRQFPIIGSKSAGSILPPTWSLDVEMQFYLVFTALTCIAGTRWRSAVNWLVVTMAAASLLLVMLQLRSTVTESTTSSLSLYFWLFAIGMWIHQARWSPSRLTALVSAGTFVGVTALLFIWPATREAIWIRGAAQVKPLIDGVLDPRSIVHMWWAIGAVVFAPFIAWNVLQKSPAWDRMLGNWAYPLYLFHWIPRDWYYSQVNWSGPAWYNGLLLAINFTAALGGSWLILKFIDQHADHWRARWVNARLAPAAPRAAPLCQPSGATFSTP